MTTTQTPLGQLTITRDGYTDDQYTNELIAAERRLAINEAMTIFKRRSRENAREMGRRVLSKLKEL